MRNQNDDYDDQNEIQKSLSWWKKCEDFDENGHLKMEPSFQLSKLTPRLRILREMERLDFIGGEGLEDLRHRLVSYRAGDFWVPVGGLKKVDMDIPSVVTILLVGLTGAGKSSLINMMYSVLGRSGLIPFAQTSSGSSTYTTMILEEHNVLRSMSSGFCAYDSRGFDCNQMDDCVEELLTWMEDGVRHNQPCTRSGDESLNALPPTTRIGSSMSNRRYAKRRVNCVMVVANLSDVHKAFRGGDMKSVDAIREIFHHPSVRKANENPMLILTHGDMLNTEERINSRLKICKYLGIPENTGAYDIPCLTEKGILPEDSDPVTAFTLIEAIYRALIQADRTHLPNNNFKDWFVIFLTWIMWCISAFFAMLADFFSRFGHTTRNSNNFSKL